MTCVFQESLHLLSGESSLMLTKNEIGIRQTHRLLNRFRCRGARKPVEHPTDAHGRADKQRSADESADHDCQCNGRPDGPLSPETVLKLNKALAIALGLP
ncbi:hypothetical protein [Rhodococcus sp. BH5]|uniref:hypothetical protein n=1 Tax=Rhodococcus sp. BH5 TaxID=2871702 RepID=UPI0022CD592E|nr:hypothetical protein [Rhodococcus sp. BH5]MCZ9635379.1 hypothetical protein [Rhodococcus sp. BH5]